jgi:hypothetical protein
MRAFEREREREEGGEGKGKREVGGLINLLSFLASSSPWF